MTDRSTHASASSPSSADLVRISLELGPWGSPDDSGWQAVYDAELDEITSSGHPIYAVLDPGLAPTPLGDELRGDAGGAGGAEEAEGWLEGYVAHAARIVWRPSRSCRSLRPRPIGGRW
jgi:hypothetical protein